MTHTATIISAPLGLAKWCTCSCGWTSDRTPTAAGASVAFAGHLAGVRG